MSANNLTDTFLEHLGTSGRHASS